MSNEKTLGEGAEDISEDIKKEKTSQEEALTGSATDVKDSASDTDKQKEADAQREDTSAVPDDDTTPKEQMSHDDTDSEQNSEDTDEPEEQPEDSASESSDEEDDSSQAYGSYCEDEEDILFENKFTYTERLLRELYKGMLSWDKKRKYSSIFIYILLGLNVAMNIVFIIIGNTGLSHLLIFTLILLGAVVAFRLLEPVILAKSMISGYEKRYGETMDVRITFSEDYITMHDVSLGATQQSAISYRRITSVHESENFVVIRLDKKQVVSVYKHGFTKGELEDFRSFLLIKIKENDAERGV